MKLQEVGSKHLSTVLNEYDAELNLMKEVQWKRMITFC